MSNSFRYLTSTDTDQQLQQLQQAHLHQDHQQQTLLPCAGADTTIDPTSLDKVPLASNNQHYEEDEERMVAATTTPSATTEEEIPDSFNQNETINLDQDPDSANSHQQLSPGLSLLQAAAASSPPPHSYRHSRAYRHFKNPPQPHMCIRTTTETGEELFINVLSWTRIVIPQEPSDPIPLYGGMRVPPGSPRSPPIVFAVMANPEVLKDSGRHSKDPEERRAMVELMCDFVEAMNPGVKLVRNAVILKDRDISGELKDVWNAVQAQRDREREEQMLQQRQQQQQHYHNLSTNGSSAGAGGGGLITPGSTTLPPNLQQQQQEMLSKSVSGLVDEGTPPRSRKLLVQESQMNEESCGNISIDMDSSNAIPLAMLAEQLDNNILAREEERHKSIPENPREENPLITNDALSNGNEFRDSTDSNVGDGGQHKNDLNNQLNANNCTTTLETKSSSSLTNGTAVGSSSNANNSETSTTSSTRQCITAVNAINTVTPPVTTTSATTTANPQPVNPPAPPTKKEKLGGFLPNGCIFPRFTKNNKHKDKDKEGKTKDKEKNVLLSALKKSKDKKAQASAAAAAAVAAAAAAASANQEDKLQKELNNTNNTSATTIATTSTIITANATTTTQHSSSAGPLNNHHYNVHLASKNCLQQLECEVQKLDLNNSDSNKSSSASNNTTAINNSTNTTTPNSATATTSSNTNKTGVGVH